MKNIFMKKIKEEILEYLFREKKEKVSVSELKSYFNLENFDEIIKSLEDEGKIKLENDFVILTDQGEKEGEDIFEKHEFVENFLKNIGVSEDFAHEKACEIEHHVSEDKLKDIHPLSELNTGEIGEIVLIRGGRGLIQRLYDMGLTPGTEIKVLRQAPFGPIEILLRGYHLSLGRGVTDRIWVKKKS